MSRATPKKLKHRFTSQGGTRGDICNQCGTQFALSHEHALDICPARDRRSGVNRRNS